MRGGGAVCTTQSLNTQILLFLKIEIEFRIEYSSATGVTIMLYSEV